MKIKTAFALVWLFYKRLTMIFIVLPAVTIFIVTALWSHCDFDRIPTLFYAYVYSLSHLPPAGEGNLTTAICADAVKSTICHTFRYTETSVVDLSKDAGRILRIIYWSIVLIFGSCYLSFAKPSLFALRQNLADTLTDSSIALFKKFHLNNRS